MRHLIHELPYERPISSGRLRYERDGLPTGAVESWRLTHAAGGYRFLRVDLDARDAASGDTWLYHVTLNPSGRPEQIKYRHWGSGHEVSGAAVWQDDEIIATRQVDGESYEDVARGHAFWFPAGSGLALLALHTGETHGVTLLAPGDDPSRLLQLVETPVQITLGPAEMETVAGELLPVRPLHVAWPDQRRTLWLDIEKRPLRLHRPDGLSACYERLISYE